MDFEKTLRRAWAIVTLDRAAMRETAADPQALVPGLVITAIGGALSAIGSFQFLLIPVTAALAVVFVAIGAAIFWGLGLAFGGKAEFVPLFRVFLHAQLTNWASLIPFVGGVVAAVWGIVVAVVTLEEVHGLSRGKAVAVVLIPVLLLSACCAVLVTMFGIALLGGAGAAGGWFGGHAG